MNMQTTKPYFDKTHSPPKFIPDKNYNIVVIGNGEVSEKLKILQNQFSFSLRVTSMAQATFSINRSTIAIVFDENELKITSPRRMNDILALYSDIPKYFLSRTKRSSNFYSNLYAKGISGIISWPREAELFPEIIIESLKMRNQSRGVSEGDERLAKIVKSHISIFSPSTDVKIKSVDGFVFIDGHTKNLFEYEIVVKEVQSVLGVKKAIAKNLSVQHVDRVDVKRLQSMIGLYVKNTAKGMVDLKYIFKDRTVTINGSIDSYKDLMSIENLIKKFSGIQKIKRDIVLTGEVKFPIKKREKEIESRLKLIFADIKTLKVTIFNKVIELEGVVGSYSTKEFTENMVLEVYPFDKVVNKLLVKK